ncbi:MAG: hypothetical protein AB1625_05130 [Acidobacteriota bacterium]
MAEQDHAPVAGGVALGGEDAPAFAQRGEAALDLGLVDPRARESGAERRRLVVEGAQAGEDLHLLVGESAGHPPARRRLVEGGQRRRGDDPVAHRRQR